MNSTLPLPVLRATLVQLRSFEAVARLGGVGRAAAQLHLAQPTVSTQLRELAQATGLQLFEPAGRGLRLTAEGELLRDTVRALYGVWQDFEEELAARRGLLRGQLRLAAVTTTEYFLPELIGPFAAAHPGLEIDLAVQNRDAVVGRLRDGSAELAVMMLPPTELPLNRLPLLQNPLVVVAPAGHALAGLKRVPLTRLLREPRLAREEGSGTRLATDQFLAERGLAWPTRMALGSNEALKHAAAAGLGLAVLSQHSLRPAMPGLVELPVGGFPLRKQWFLVWRSDRELGHAARALLDAWRQRPPAVDGGQPDA